MMSLRMKSLVAGCAFALIAAATPTRRIWHHSTPIRKRIASTGRSLRRSSALFRRQPAGTKIGGVSKTLTNEYWRSLGEGYAAYAKHGRRRGRLSGGASEGDQLGQLSTAENLISQGFNALLFSPQTDNNLQPALE